MMLEVGFEYMLKKQDTSLLRLTSIVPRMAFRGNVRRVAYTLTTFTFKLI